ncbi:carbonic anhydrase [Aurantimicrobium minutum]|uniref:carbonic anhydrase n=1 Tax=Aurantimicrobium minutum TaxID=708131 RepID=UPI0024061AFE|nr:carbonic anhydrase [Aurantimicrobium minutum]MDF9810308.1 carbonic anhydrase [Aurantimicrobium minutum]
MTRITPAKAWAEMARGNERFVSGAPAHPRQDVDRRAELVDEQRPTSALFGCSDSRLAAEIIFDKGLGDLFVVRNAGQIISDSVVGSLEYAVGVLEVPLIVVLGHDNCGAVNGAINMLGPDSTPLPPHIEALVSRIVPAIRRVAGKAGLFAPDGSLNPEQVDALAVGREHLRDTIAELMESSELITQAIAEGNLAIVGANYRLGQGRVQPDVVVGDIGV